MTGSAEPLGEGGEGGTGGTWPEAAGAARDGEDTRLALFDQVADALLRGGRPLVAVLDDLQWADAASVLLLGHLGRRVRAPAGEHVP
ncbi:AAA family ATPase [Streptomyces sp. NPDC094032]|uniref:ATP-binding protein n=1 Tax=Streptomyces sp. NPDC094032 TaxID=3155308 RepID=UPI00332F5149